jgi:hypothetical protein
MTARGPSALAGPTLEFALTARPASHSRTSTPGSPATPPDRPSLPVLAAILVQRFVVTTIGAIEEVEIGWVGSNCLIDDAPATWADPELTR